MGEPSLSSMCSIFSFLGLPSKSTLQISINATPQYYTFTTNLSQEARPPTMDSNTSSFLFNSSNFPSAFYQAKQDDDGGGMIDLGLSLRTVQPEAYHHSSGNLLNLGGYDHLMNWPQSNLNLKSSGTMQSRSVPEIFDEETEGVQSNERWAYVKVNMDGVAVGRKICVLDFEGYPSLAIQLENMFGSKSVSGLRLFRSGSEYSLFYKDREDNWRTVGDVPWKEFVECVKRLRIARKNAASVSCSSRNT